MGDAMGNDVDRSREEPEVKLDIDVRRALMLEDAGNSIVQSN